MHVWIAGRCTNSRLSPAFANNSNGLSSHAGSKVALVTHLMRRTANGTWRSTKRLRGRGVPECVLRRFLENSPRNPPICILSNFIRDSRLGVLEVLRAKPLVTARIRWNAIQAHALLLGIKFPKQSVQNQNPGPLGFCEHRLV